MSLISYPRFRGNWNLAWVSGRYVVEAAAGLTARKVANAALVVAEMKAARPVVRSLPLAVRLEPTSLCNLRCPRCSTGLGIEPRPKGFLALHDVDRLVDQVKSHAMFVRLDGNGEPLLHPEITGLITRIKAGGIGIALSTHLNNAPKGGWQDFVEAAPDRVIVAIDGADQKVYERYRRGGNLAVVQENLAELVAARARKRSRRRRPHIDLQFLDWGYNHHQIPEMHAMARKFGADRVTVIEPDLAVSAAKADPLYPKRCFWLWAVLTVGWQLELHSCTNAWTYPFPRLNLRTATVREAWNSAPFVEARRFNKNKKSRAIAESSECMCNQCTDMLVVDRPPGYVCE